jgi:segregation and condensation protein B
MRDLQLKIESVLLFKNEPVTLAFLAKRLGVDTESIKAAVTELAEFYRGRGIVMITDGEEVSFGTRPENHSLIEDMQKEELSRELGRAGLETLAIILYKSPVSRREIDYIRGVNSTFILRNLLIRGLIERHEAEGERGYRYKPTLKLLEHLGITRLEELPQYEAAFKKLEEFVNAPDTETDEETQ